MVVIRLELWRKGNPAHSKELGRAEITNTGRGTESRGHYVAHFFGKKGRHIDSVSVDGFPRKRLLGWDLLFRAMRPIFERRNPEGRTQNHDNT